MSIYCQFIVKKGLAGFGAVFTRGRRDSFRRRLALLGVEPAMCSPSASTRVLIIVPIRKQARQKDWWACFQTRPTRFEPATSGSTVRCSNQLSYGPVATFPAAVGHRPIRDGSHILDSERVLSTPFRPLRKKTVSRATIESKKRRLGVCLCLGHRGRRAFGQSLSGGWVAVTV